MTDHKKYRLHQGELRLHERLGVPSRTKIAMPQFIIPDMPAQYADFFTHLPYLPLATLDDRGRPWATLLVTTSRDDPSVGIKISEGSRTDIVAEANPYDPFTRALKAREMSAPDERSLFAGVGIDFTNRRRNKLAGTVKLTSIDPTGKVGLTLNSDQHLGNCPKYITVRSLAHQARTAELGLDSYDALTSPLPDAAKALIDRASTVFLATRHSPIGTDDAEDDRTDMGFNHRGGAPGFVRAYEESEDGTVTTYLILPDHSGNRFYQSLGNIETNRQVGLTFPDFTTGDMLYVTGEADNLFDKDAEAIMPRVGLLTRIRVAGAVFVKGGLNLQLTSEERYSPYNPPVRYLRRELEQMGHSAIALAASDEPLDATLISTQRLSDTVSTFTFELSEAIEAPSPGGFGIFDFSGILNTGYRHMNDANPQLVNEDYVRTWTLSNAASFDADKNLFGPSNHVSVTVKRKPGGLMSNFLHYRATHHAEATEKPMRLKFKGAGAGFSCFKRNPKGGLPDIPSKMLWIAGGIGITPFMSMWDGILNIANASPETTEDVSTDIVLLFSGRGDDVNLLRHFLASSSSWPERLTLSILAYQSVGDNSEKAQSALQALERDFPDSRLKVARRRLQVSDIETVERLLEREIFLCGPGALTMLAEETLSGLGDGKLKIHQESYSF